MWTSHHSCTTTGVQLLPARDLLPYSVLLLPPYTRSRFFQIPSCNFTDVILMELQLRCSLSSLHTDHLPVALTSLSEESSPSRWHFIYLTPQQKWRAADRVVVQSCWRRLFSACPLIEHPVCPPAISLPKYDKALLMSPCSTQPQNGRSCDLFHTKKAANRGGHRLGLLCHGICDTAFR